MQYSTKLKLFIVGILAAAVFGRIGCYYANAAYDTYRRPWAYNSDPDKPLLVGKWTGQTTDPDGVAHVVELEIFEPLSDEQRQERFSNRRIKRDRSSRTYFDGLAIVTARGTPDSCRIWGGLDAPYGQQIHFEVRPLDDQHPPGFNINLVEGSWQVDELFLKVDFAFFRPDGSSFSDSADPRFNQQSELRMKRLARG